MTEQEKRKAIWTYLNTRIPTWAYWLIGIGILTTLSGDAGAIVVGLLMAGAGGATMYFRTQTITDAEFDRFRNEDLDRLEAKALHKWGIDKGELAGDAVLVWGPSMANTGTFAVKAGKDGIIRYNPVRFALFGFGEHQMLAYQGLLDMVTANVLDEGTEEFFYRDVVSVSTKTNSSLVTLNGHTRQLNDTETFVLTTSGGTSVSVPLRSASLAGLVGGGEMPTTHAEKAIAAVRSMLRQKKSVVTV